MDTIVVIVLVVLGIAAVIGSVIAYCAFHNAPDGFEDHRGFHIKRRPKP